MKSKLIEQIIELAHKQQTELANTKRLISKIEYLIDAILTNVTNNADLDADLDLIDYFEPLSKMYQTVINKEKNIHDTIQSYLKQLIEIKKAGIDENTQNIIEQFFQQYPEAETIFKTEGQLSDVRQFTKERMSIDETVLDTDIDITGN